MSNPPVEDAFADFRAMSPEQLATHADQWEDQLAGTEPGDCDWVFVPELPIDRLWPAKEAEWWWEEQNAEAEENGMGGLWDALLEEEIEEPIIVTFFGGEKFSIRDGNHRAAAVVITSRQTIPAVVGILKGMDLDKLPEEVATAVRLATQRSSQPSP
jgi:hypothetical protein